MRPLWVLLGVLCTVMFVTSSTGSSRSPFLLAMADDLATSLAAVANLVAFSSVTWGLASLVAGPLSDRVGRRPVLVGSVASLAVSLVVMTLAPTYLIAVIAAAWGGLSGGATSATIYATVADNTPPERRGRALGWVMTGQSLALVLGVPLATLIGVVGGWRGASAAQALAAGLLVLAVWWAVPGGHGSRPVDGVAATGSASIRAALNGPILALLGSSVAERVCYAGMAVYLPTYLLTSYTVDLPDLALALALIALGNVAGNLLGSQLADRVPERMLVVATASIGTGLLAVPLFYWQPGLVGSIALGGAYTLVNALGRPALVASLSLAPAATRGTVLGLNVTAASIGWLAAAALGGWLIAATGFEGLGLLIALMGVAGAVLAGWARWLSAISHQHSAAIQWSMTEEQPPRG